MNTEFISNDRNHELQSEEVINQENEENSENEVNVTQSPQNSISESGEIPKTPATPSSSISSLNQSVLQEGDDDGPIGSPSLNQSDIDSQPITPHLMEIDLSNFNNEGVENISNETEPMQPIESISGTVSRKSTSNSKSIPILNKSKKIKKNKQKSSKKMAPKKIITRKGENNFRISLTEENRNIYDKVMQLRELSSKTLENPSTNHIVRPCISWVNSESLTLENWQYFDKFAEYYIRRFEQEEIAFQCKFSKGKAPQFNLKDKFGIVKIFGDINNREFLLIQYEPTFIDSTKNFENYQNGEISWVHKSIVGTNTTVFKDYSSGRKDFKCAFTRETFDARPTDSLKIFENT